MLLASPWPEPFGPELTTEGLGTKANFLLLGVVWLNGGVVVAEVWLDFERPVVELEKKIEELKVLASSNNLEVREEIARLEKKAETMRKEIYSKLSPWQRVQLARHPDRPYTLDFIGYAMDDFIELHGDRCYGDDPAVVGGIGSLNGRSIVLIGHQKGRQTREKIVRNFGMPHPEGYRKALRLMQFGAKFGKPILTLIDTPGAYPGVGAEERGQAEAIARNLKEMASLPVPIICVVTGEGGSGGALAIGVGNRVLMMANAIYSVITPEGCASILWRDSSKAPEAAEALKLTASDLNKLKVIDGIIPEPSGGAHRDPKKACGLVRGAVLQSLSELEGLSPEQLVNERANKYYKMGSFREASEIGRAKG